MTAPTLTPDTKTAALADEVVAEVRKNSVCIVPEYFSAEECDNFVRVLKEALARRLKAGKYFGSRNQQVMYNFFVENEELYPLVFNPLIDAVMTQLIDEDYVLISPSARNPQVRPDLPEGVKTSGAGWHIDSKVCDREGNLYQPSMSYYSATAIEAFTPDNAATHYIPKSHLRYKKPKDRNAELEHETLRAPAGSLVFFDSAMWHKVGTPTPVSRWSVFNMYGPWFMKPYFRFRDNYTEEQAQKLPSSIRKILHFTSTPPVNEFGPHTSTVVRETPGKSA